MPHPRNNALYAARVVNVALDLVDRHEQRLVAILESAETTQDQKYQALVDLAHLTGILVREMSEAGVSGGGAQSTAPLSVQ